MKISRRSYLQAILNLTDLKVLRLEVTGTSNSLPEEDSYAHLLLTRKPRSLSECL